MTSCKLLEEEEGWSTLERSPRQVSRLGSFRAVLTKSLYVTWENNGEVVELVDNLLGNMKELVVLLFFPNRLASREKHLDVLVEVSVLEELAVVLQEADQLLPGKEEFERWRL